MLVIAVAAKILSVWLGAWIAGLDLTISRDYFSVALVAVLMPLWRTPFGLLALKIDDSVHPFFIWLIFTGMAWVFEFLVITFAAGKALGGSFKQCSIVSATVIGIDLFMSKAIPFMFG